MKEKNLKLVINLRHELHQHPEISNEEYWTKNHLIDFLKRYTSLEIVDKGKWFYAFYEGDKSRDNIAFRADFDAVEMEESIEIPWKSKNSCVSHKCGHDGHAASLAGFALEVDQEGSDKNIYFLFQHAEETGDGAKKCVEMLRENKIDEIYAYHNMSGMPFNTINIIYGTAHFASRGMIIKMKGKTSHASEPEKGINPAFTAAKIINQIPKLTSKKNNKGLVLCTVVQIDIGKEAFGISPGEGRLLLTIRSQYEEELIKLQNNIKSIACNEAEKSGLKVDFYDRDVFPETVNHRENVDKAKKVGEIKNFKVNKLKKPFRASEDFGYYTKLIKGAIFYIGNGENYPDIHTSEYDFRDEIIERAVEMFKGLADI